MSVLDVTDLDRLADHQRIPSVSDVDAYGDQDDDYAVIEADVPIRIEQKEVEALDREVASVIKWTGFVHSSIANVPRIDDRFDIAGSVFHVHNTEQLTDFDGTVSHYEMDMEVIESG